MVLLNGQDLKDVSDAELAAAYKTVDATMIQAIQNEVTIRRQLADQPLSRFDAAEYLDSNEARAEYLRAARETEDVAFVIDAMGVVARAIGMHNACAS